MLWLDVSMISRAGWTSLAAFAVVDAIAVAGLCRLSVSVGWARTGFGDGPGMPFMVGFDIVWFLSYLVLTTVVLVAVSAPSRVMTSGPLTSLIVLFSGCRILFAFTVWYNRDLTRLLLVRLTSMQAWPFGIYSWPAWRWVVLVVTFDLLLLWALLVLRGRSSDSRT